MKCFQLSCRCRLKLICTNGRHLGRLGLRMRCRPASCGVRLALLRVAADAGADDVFPRRRAAAVARDDVVEVQILAVKNFAAILAGVFVALENVVARELDLLLRQPVVHQQQDDARHADAEGDGVDGFLVRRGFGKIAPFVKIKRAERAVRRRS